MEGIQQLIRQKLNIDKIKLWLPPYTLENNQPGDEIGILVTRYSKDLVIAEDKVRSAIESLRTHALEKLDARNKFQKSGLATLKVKFTGPTSDKRQEANVEIPLTSKGEALKDMVSNLSGLQTNRLKLISCGHVIEDDKTLQEQYVKNSSMVMAITLSQTEADMREKEKNYSLVQKTVQAAEVLSDKKDDHGGTDSEYYLQIADQTGKNLELPPEERKALAVAMTLNEKGRACLKRKEYGTAILLLLEADKEFRKCRSAILDAVDNYAVLCLDIVWCYLCLKNVNDLPDAETRLSTCEQCFHKSYGENLERLTVVKGSTGNELALYMRLHLLQGILAYYQGNRNRASYLLELSESELSKLRIDDESLNQVMSLGFTDKEARLGLRACQGDIQSAVDHILKRRQEKRELKEKESQERKKNKLSRNLGKTADGKWVDSEKYEQLVSMGFPKGASKEALRQTNNSIDLSLKVLQDNPELMSLPDPKLDNTPINITDDMLQQVVSMGFDTTVARQVLQNMSGDVIRAVEELLRNGGIIASSSGESSSSSSSDTSASSTDDQKQKKSIEEIAREKEAIDAIVPDIPEDEEDYLDIDLVDEENFLKQYKDLTNMMR